MAMPSQSPRPSASRTYSRSRRRRRSKLPYLLIATAVTVGLVWFLWPEGDATDPGDQPPPPPAAGDLAGGAPSGDRTTSLVGNGGSDNSGNSGQQSPSNGGASGEDESPRQTPLPPPPADRGEALSGDSNDSRLAEGVKMLDDGRLVEGRKTLSELLLDAESSLTPHDARVLRTRLMEVNKKLIFSGEVSEDDPLTFRYKVQPGDRLGSIASRNYVPYALLERINKMQANRMAAGRNIKIIRGPFHARVDQSEFRLDLYLMGPEGKAIYIHSMPVGLGEQNSTPMGQWVVKSGSKVKNPGWTNPRTHKTWDRDDPKIPIGEFWMALQGLDEGNAEVSGYGIHGTDEPESIGKQMSMGCVRLRDDDIALLFDMLEDGKSTVQIVP